MPLHDLPSALSKEQLLYVGTKTGYTPAMFSSSSQHGQIYLTSGLLWVKQYHSSNGRSQGCWMCWLYAGGRGSTRLRQAMRCGSSSPDSHYLDVMWQDQISAAHLISFTGAALITIERKESVPFKCRSSLGRQTFKVNVWRTQGTHQGWGWRGRVFLASWTCWYRSALWLHQHLWKS